MEGDQMMSSLISLQDQDQQQQGETNNPNPNPNREMISNSEQEGEGEGEGKGEDRISALPDAIILHMLSFLLAKDAVKTGLLSTRWKYLWTSVPNLAFENQSSSPRQFIDQTLLLYSSNKINKFSLKIDCVDILAKSQARDSNQLHSSISSWLQFAALRQVEELRLKVDTGEELNFVIPDFLYRHPSFTKIVTTYCDYSLPSGGVRWGLLKELKIKYAQFQDGESIQKVLLGCPLLESLELIWCVYFHKIDTSSNVRLKRLVLDQVMYLDPDFGNVEISIPHVTSLKISGTLHHTQFRLSNESSLVDVTLDFDNFDMTLPECCHWVWQLLQTVKHVDKLTIGTWCIQVLSVAMARRVCPPLSKNKWTCLTLATGFEKCDVIGVANLLHNSPCLEKLVLDKAYPPYGSLEETYQLNYHIGRNYLTSQARSFYCLQRVLKTIQVVGLERHSDGRGFLLKFIKSLLHRAKVLEKLVIVAPRGLDADFDLDTQQTMMEDYYRRSQLLLSFPKSSPQVVVLFTK